MLQFLYLAGKNESPEPFPDQLLEHLRGLVACETVSYGGYDPKRRGWRRKPRWVGEPQAITASIREAHQALRHQYPHTPSDPAPVLRWSDRFSRKTWRRFALYCEVGRPCGVEHTLTIFLRDGAQVFGSFAFDHFDGDFNDRDVDVLEALTPHLLQFAKNADARLPGPATELTPREREVLAWVSRGKTNQQIAATLYISPGTVGKHLENIYAKLDVSNRTAAVRRAYGPPSEGSLAWASVPECSLSGAEVTEVT
jgi:DNA-binding CsgD family transcriptional regulator